MLDGWRKATRRKGIEKLFPQKKVYDQKDKKASLSFCFEAARYRSPSNVFWKFSPTSSSSSTCRWVEMSSMSRPPPKKKNTISWGRVWKGAASQSFWLKVAFLRLIFQDCFKYFGKKSAPRVVSLNTKFSKSRLTKKKSLVRPGSVLYFISSIFCTFKHDMLGSFWPLWTPLYYPRYRYITSLFFINIVLKRRTHLIYT